MAGTKVYIVDSITRAHSSGFENRVNKAFTTLEGASEWIQKELKGFCVDYDWPDSWDKADMGGADAPDPVAISAVSRLQLILSKSKGWTALVWGPESEYEVQRPVEITIQEMAVRN